MYVLKTLEFIHLNSQSESTNAFTLRAVAQTFSQSVIGRKANIFLLGWVFARPHINNAYKHENGTLH